MSEDLEPEAPQPLQHKPRRPSGWRLSSLLLVLGIGILVGGGGLLAWQGLAHQGSQTPGASTNASGTDKSQLVSQAPPGPQGDRPIYWQTIQQQVAQGLHLSVAQIQAQLQVPLPAPAGSKGRERGIADIALAQGIPQAQLHTLELQAIQDAYAQLVSQGIVTQQQADQGMQTIQGWDQGTLNNYVTGAFTGH
jgi:hypothetical protein